MIMGGFLGLNSKRRFAVIENKNWTVREGDLVELIDGRMVTIYRIYERRLSERHYEKILETTCGDSLRLSDIRSIQMNMGE